VQVNVEWVDTHERLHHPGEPVAAATFGTWPHDFHDRSVAGEHYWLVRLMVFHDLYIPMTFQHQSEDESHYHDCFVDSDGIIRYPRADRVRTTSPTGRRCRSCRGCRCTWQAARKQAQPSDELVKPLAIGSPPHGTDAPMDVK